MTSLVHFVKYRLKWNDGNLKILCLLKMGHELETLQLRMPSPAAILIWHTLEKVERTSKALKT